jgi:hypothetical protein
MKTEQLIARLSAAAAPAPSATWRRLAISQAVALLGALALMLAVLGLRPDLASASELPMFWIKQAFPGAIALIAMGGVARLGRPGARVRHFAPALALPVALLWAIAAAELLHAEPDLRLPLVLGQTWKACSALIVVLSILPMAAALWALKGLAPTRLALAGAAAGALAGAEGAFIYALHCTEMHAAFLGVWYLIGVAAPAIAGALLGPRLLRW